MKILCDTSFIFSFLTTTTKIADSDLLDTKMEFMVPQTVIKELEGLVKKANPKRARLAKEVINKIKENIPVIESDVQTYVDDLLIQMATENMYAVATMDSNLRKRLIKNNIPVITMSNNKIIIISNPSVRK